MTVFKDLLPNAWMLKPKDSGLCAFVSSFFQSYILWKTGFIQCTVTHMLKLNYVIFILYHLYFNFIFCICQEVIKLFQFSAPKWEYQNHCASNFRLWLLVASHLPLLKLLQELTYQLAPRSGKHLSLLKPLPEMTCQLLILSGKQQLLLKPLPKLTCQLLILSGKQQLLLKPLPKLTC